MELDIAIIIFTNICTIVFIIFSKIKSAAFQAKDGTRKMSSSLSCDTILKSVKDLCTRKRYTLPKSILSQIQY